MAPKPLLSMCGIGKRHLSVVALRDVPLPSVPSRYALVDENGAGKPTLINILSDAIHADAGEIEIGGERLAKRTRTRPP